MPGLEVLEIAQGLWRWTAPHPEWTPEKGVPGGWGQMVGCVHWEAPEAIVLVDPLAPPPGTPDEERFWRALDADVRRAARPVAILLANHYHVRSAAAVQARYASGPGASVWLHEAAPAGTPRTHTFRAGSALPGGIQAHPVSALGADEVVFHIPPHRTLVAADAILGAGGGQLRLAPLTWAEKTDEGRAHYERSFRAEIRRLLELPIDRVLVSHGEPVLEDGGSALAAALAAPAWGE